LSEDAARQKDSQTLQRAKLDSILDASRSGPYASEIDLVNTASSKTEW